jgi:hypothetical protein
VYTVSKEYKEAMKQPVQHFRIRGTIDNTMGTVLEFTEKNILQFRTANQCTDSGTIKIGGVYVGELSAAFTGLPAWFQWNPYRQGTIIKAYVSRLLPSGQWEEIPLTPYTMSTMERTAFGWETVAYDNMSKLDKTYDGYAFAGSIYNMATLACSLCGIEFGMTQMEVQALPNGNYNYFAMYPENDIGTYRDVISYLAQLVVDLPPLTGTESLCFAAFLLPPQTPLQAIAALPGQSSPTSKQNTTVSPVMTKCRTVSCTVMCRYWSAHTWILGQIHFCNTDCRNGNWTR